MTEKDLFDLKSFSYFSRDYRYVDFLRDLEGKRKTNPPTNKNALVDNLPPASIGGQENQPSLDPWWIIC